MPNEGDAIRGVDIGRLGCHARETYIWVICSNCKQERWRAQTDIRRAKRPKSYLNLCHHCAVSSKGADCHSWKGGRLIDKEGYILVYVMSNDFFAPMRNYSGYVREHRLVMAKHLGRCLHRWELVHHKNQTRDDNRIENLQLISDTRHNQITILEKRIAYLEGKVLSLGGTP